MENIKGIGKVAIWLLGHFLCLAIYTIDRMINVFTPWNASPKYLTWYSYVDLNEVNSTFYKSCARVIVVIVGYSTYWLSNLFFDNYAFLISLAFDLCLIGMIVSVDRIKSNRAAKNALKTIPVIILILTSCGKQKDHIVDIYIPDVVNTTEQVTITGSDGIPMTFETGFYENVKLTGKEFKYTLTTVNNSGMILFNKNSFHVYDAQNDGLRYELYIDAGTTESGTFILK